MALESVENELVYKEKYRTLKRKLQYLIYVSWLRTLMSLNCLHGLSFQENECFSVEIRNMEKKLLRILKDRSFLLDLLMQHETVSPEFDSTDNDVTDSSEDESKSGVKNAEKKLVMSSKYSVFH